MYKSIIQIVVSIAIVAGMGFCIQWARSRENVYGVIALILLMMPISLFLIALFKCNTTSITIEHTPPSYDSINKTDAPPIYEIV